MTRPPSVLEAVDAVETEAYDDVTPVRVRRPNARRLALGTALACAGMAGMVGAIVYAGSAALVVLLGGVVYAVGVVWLARSWLP